VVHGVTVFPSPVRGHKDGTLAYNENPPVGGIHNPSWQNCGIYSQPVAKELGVHSLEHGAIWITYQPGIAASDLEKLRQLTRGSGYRLLSPDPASPSPIVAAAWGYQLKLDRTDDSRLVDFLKRYEQNPQGPEPGAACSGGQGQPEG